MSPPLPTAIWRLLLVVARTSRPWCRVGEVGEPVDLVLVEHAGLHRDDREGHAEQQQHDQVPGADPGDHQDRERRRHQHQVRTEVGLQHDQPHRQRADHERDDEPAGVMSSRCIAQYAGEHEDQEELGELARLELERPDVEPCLRTLHVRADPQHRDEHQDRRAVPEQRELAELAVVDRGEHRPSRRRPPRSRRPGASRSRTGRARPPRACGASTSRSSAARARRAERRAEEQRIDVTQRRRVEPRPAVGDDDRARPSVSSPSAARR